MEKSPDSDSDAPIVMVDDAAVPELASKKPIDRPTASKAAAAVATLLILNTDPPKGTHWWQAQE